MRCARAALLALALAVGSRAALAETAAAELLDRSHDRIVLRADITSRGGRHGEVRLVERGSARVVQTLLFSKLLRRVVGGIRERERENWPPEAEGYQASARYVQALERAEQSIPRPSAGDRGPTAERRRPLLIEFAASGSAATVALLEPRVAEVDGSLVIAGARLVERLALPRAFIERDMRLIAEEHFPAARDEIARLLSRPGPGEAAGSQPDGTP